MKIWLLPYREDSPLKVTIKGCISGVIVFVIVTSLDYLIANWLNL